MFSICINCADRIECEWIIKFEVILGTQYIGLEFKTILVNWSQCFIVKEWNEAGNWKYYIPHGKIMCGLIKYTLVKQKKTRHYRRSGWESYSYGVRGNFPFGLFKWKYCLKYSWNSLLYSERWRLHQKYGI